MNSQRTRGYHGRGNTRGRGAGALRSQFIARPEETLPIPDSSQEQLARVSGEELTASSSLYDKVTVEGVQYVASYNWLDDNSPKILVPGVPAKWLPPGLKTQLKQDDGQYFRDPNAARYPQYPVEPAISAIFHTRPDFDSASIDIFACGGTMGSLLSFISGEKRTFRFGVELIGKCLFLVRRTNTPKQLIDDVYGYGHNFLETYTAWDAAARGSVSHQRIITYTLGGMKCLIRSECDGYLAEKVPSSGAHRGTPTRKLSEPHDDFEDAHSAIEALRVNPLDTNDNDDLAIQSTAVSVLPIPQEAIFDIKTRSIARLGNIGVDDFLQRLFVNQTPNLILAFHQRGVFEKSLIEIHDVRENVKEWEVTHATHLKCLKALLATLRKRASQADGARLEVRRTETGPLEIWTSPDGWEALPVGWRTRWIGKEGVDDVDGEVDSKEHDEDLGVRLYP